MQVPSDLVGNTGAVGQADAGEMTIKVSAGINRCTAEVVINNVGAQNRINGAVLIEINPRKLANVGHGVSNNLCACGVNNRGGAALGFSHGQIL